MPVEGLLCRVVSEYQNLLGMVFHFHWKSGGNEAEFGVEQIASHSGQYE